jgi:hypothetical protein
VLLRRLKKKGNRAGTELLIQWKGTTEQDATWEDLDELQTNFLDHVGNVFRRKRAFYAHIGPSLDGKKESHAYTRL